MAKKKSGRPHGHYCKICGEYKANEKFSGRGHAAHICKACSRLSAAEQAEAMTINRLMNLPMGRLSANDKAWLENRLHDHRPEVASLAQEVYKLYFPYTERNKRKKQLIINTLSFELHTEVFDEYGDELPVNCRFTANRISRVLTMTDFDGDGVEQSLILEGKKMSTLLRWVVHSLEIFMWPEDYNLTPSQGWPDDWEDEESEFDGEFESDEAIPEPEEDISWQVEIAYADHSTQEIVSYQGYLLDRPEELYHALLEYFQPEQEDFDVEYDEEASFS
ncbi:MAG: hypothetical protein HFF17_13565 [Oscillospiraceae bacterium]|nr:hypothetical protein [Oscillospiraceae bacterium]